MDEYISIDDLIEYCDSERAAYRANNCGAACTALRRVVEFAKENAVEAEPVKHGRWIIDYAEGTKIYHAHCSECGKEPNNHIGGDYYIDKLSDYCPNCGSKNRMDGDRE